jgi:elongation factor P
MYTAADLRKGLKVIIDNDPYIVTVFDFSKPGKGQALYRTKMRNMITGITLERTFREGDTFEPASLEEREMQYLTGGTLLLHG